MYIRFINGNKQEAIISSEAPYILKSFDGFGDVGADVQSQEAPYMDGSIYIDSVLEERDLTIELTIVADDIEQLMQMKKDLSKVFNPKHGQGILRYRRGDNVYEISCVPEHAPEFPSGSGNRGMTHQKAVIDLVAHDPYWHDLNQVTRALTAYKGLFTLPFTLPFELGRQGDQTSIYNAGDVPAPIQIDLQGPSTNPQIRNKTTGEYMKVNAAIGADEILHIDTTENKKRIEIYRGDTILNIFGALDYAGGASFFELVPGYNDIEYVADSGTREGVATVAWKNRYIGI